MPQTLTDTLALDCQPAGIRKTKHADNFSAYSLSMQLHRVSHILIPQGFGYSQKKSIYNHFFVAHFPSLYASKIKNFGLVENGIMFKKKKTGSEIKTRYGLGSGKKNFEPEPVGPYSLQLYP